MTLKNKLYTIADRQHEGGTTRFSLNLNAGHEIYGAHFPGEPVTPGVCLVQMAGELLEECLGRKLQLKKAVNVKFLSPVSPVMTPSVRFTVTPAPADAEGLIHSSVRVEYDSRVMAKMSLIHSPAV